MSDPRVEIASDRQGARRWARLKPRERVLLGWMLEARGRAARVDLLDMARRVGFKGDTLHVLADHGLIHNEGDHEVLLTEAGWRACIILVSGAEE